MESVKKEQLNSMPTSSFNFLEALPDVVFYAVMEKLPARVIESTVRQLSRNCLRRVELCRARLPHFYFDMLYVHRDRFCYRVHSDRAGNDEYDDDNYYYTETIDPSNLIQHLNYLKERATFKTLNLQDANWDMFANCKFECEELSCIVKGTTLSPETFMEIFRNIGPTLRLSIRAYGDNKIFPVAREFFINNYAIGLQEVWLRGYGDAMVDPVDDTILLDSTPLILHAHFRSSPRCTLNGILTMFRDWYTSERQIDGILLQVVAGKAELQNFLHNLPELQTVRVAGPGYISFSDALKRANGDVVELCIRTTQEQDYYKISVIRLVLWGEVDRYMRYCAVE